MFLVYGVESWYSKGIGDASFQFDVDDTKFRFSFLSKLNGVVAWKSSKQDTSTDSTIEVEYIAASEATKKAI
ncbi:UNVERIFIED_CONTAM: hypothetical protein Sradi_4096500 [Sesamum radiatum]|uniref:Uncharacterized protein n=1 Tax=Sesamum radiatum TaxID=300843 RepID=A0AAW2P203_SESRA